MSTLDEWLTETTHALGLPADAIPADLRGELLDLTRDVAHGVARIAGPLTCYLLGMAVAHGSPPSTALAAVTDLVHRRESAGTRPLEKSVEFAPGADTTVPVAQEGNPIAPEATE